MSSKRGKTKGKKNTRSKPGGDVDWWGNNSLQPTKISYEVSDEDANDATSKRDNKKVNGRKRSKSTTFEDQYEKPKKGKNANSKNNKEVSVEEKTEEKKEEKPDLISLDNPSPPIWTFGSIIVFIAVLACEIYQNSGFTPFALNPMYGPSNEVMVIMGAKVGRNILAGDWWRFLTAIFLHSGCIHLVIVIIFLIYNSSVERDTGFWRALCVFVLSGSFGFILSSILLPEAVSCGAVGCAFGFFGLQLGDLISTWRMKNNGCKKLSIIICLIVLGVALGLTPYLDNFCNIGGFVMGVLIALMLLPNLNFGKCETICHGLIAFLSFPITTFIFCFSLVYFYRMDDGFTCDWCYKINCINIKDWCPQVTKIQSNVYNISTLPKL